MSLFKLCFGGLVAAYFQLSVVVVASLIVLSAMTKGLGSEVPLSAAPSDLPQWAIRFGLLRWIVLLSAICVAFTKNWCIDDTTEEIRRTSQSLAPAEPKNVVRVLLAQFLLVAVGCGILIFETPPLLLIVFCYHLYGEPTLAWLAWAGIMSVAAAFFGASAHAAGQGLR